MGIRVLKPLARRQGLFFQNWKLLNYDNCTAGWGFLDCSVAAERCIQRYIHPLRFNPVRRALCRGDSYLIHEAVEGSVTLVVTSVASTDITDVDVTVDAD